MEAELQQFVDEEVSSYEISGSSIEDASVLSSSFSSDYDDVSDKGSVEISPRDLEIIENVVRNATIMQDQIE